MTTPGVPTGPRTATARYCATVACAAILAAGCQTTTEHVSPAPAPPLELLDAARFDLPADCSVASGRTYRMSYTIGIDGRTGSLGAITPPDAPACLQAALSSWVSSFQYAPLSQAEAATTDWMLVTAKRGS